MVLYIRVSHLRGVKSVYYGVALDRPNLVFCVCSFKRGINKWEYAEEKAG